MFNLKAFISNYTKMFLVNLENTFLLNIGEFTVACHPMAFLIMMLSIIYNSVTGSLQHHLIHSCSATFHQKEIFKYLVNQDKHPITRSCVDYIIHLYELMHLRYLPVSQITQPISWHLVLS